MGIGDCLRERGLIERYDKEGVEVCCLRFKVLNERGFEVPCLRLRGLGEEGFCCLRLRGLKRYSELELGIERFRRIGRG